MTWELKYSGSSRGRKVNITGEIGAGAFYGPGKGDIEKEQLTAS